MMTEGPRIRIRDVLGVIAMSAFVYAICIIAGAA